MGRNPYIDAEPPPLPDQPYTLTVKRPGGEDIVLQIDPDDLPYDHEGNEGSILSILIEHGVQLDHTCGGVCACSTCHIYVRQGMETSPEPIEEEEDQLDMAPAVSDDSRLACQFVPDGSTDVVVEIPAWKPQRGQRGPLTPGALTLA